MAYDTMIENDGYVGTSVHCVGDRECWDDSESSDVSHTTFASAVATTEEILELSNPGGSEKVLDFRIKKVFKWYTKLACPTRETLCRVIDYTSGLDITRECVDLLPWKRGDGG
jgi:hypothetical protein